MGLRINHNLASLGASMNLGRANSALSASLGKLSTGLKINSAADGPADLIISEKFRSQINSISKAVENTQNAISMLSTAEGALNEVNSLLSKMQGLALKAAQTGTQSTDEVAASQAEIDAALESINNISRNTSFGSLNLLDGSQAIQTTGVDTSKFLVDIDKANFAGDTKNLNIKVVSAANRASTTLDLTASGQGGGTDGVLTSSQVLKITGNRGSTTITFAAGSTYTQMAEEITAQVTQTGVIAEAAENKLTMKSAKYGASEFVTVEDVDGDNNLLTINNSTVAAGVTTTERTLDLTKVDLGQSFKVSGVEVRTVGANGSKYAGYTVDIAVAANAVGATVAVNDAAKTIQINTSTAVTVTSIAQQLSVATGMSWEAVASGGKAIVAADAVDGLIVGGVHSNLTIKAKVGTAAALHADAPKLIINYNVAGIASYAVATNTLTLTLVSGTSYTDSTLSAAVTAGLAQGNPGGMFDFSMNGGSGRIDKTSTSKSAEFSTTAVNSSTLGADFSNNAGTGKSFRLGGTSNFGFKTTSIGNDKYGDYSVIFKVDGSASVVTVDHSVKTITVATTATSTAALIITAINGAAGAAMFTSTVGAGGAVGASADVTKTLTADTSGLIVTAKKNDSSTFAPRIAILQGGAAAIAYTSGTQTITLTVLSTAVGFANPTDTQNELDILLDAAGAAGAKLKSLFDFKVTGPITATTMDSVALTAGGASATGSTTTANTNYIKANGTDGSLEVNGVKTAANNLTYTFDNGNIRGSITIAETLNKAGESGTFTIAGKGAFLQLGAKTQLSHQIGVGIQSVAVDQLATGQYLDTSLNPATSNLDDSKLYTTATLADITSGGEFDLSKNANTAYDIISQAILEVSVARSKLGALISNTLESNINSLGVAFENLTAAESRIRDVDFASETAEFTRAQILVQAGTSVAAQANVATQAALQLLG